MNEPLKVRFGEIFGFFPPSTCTCSHACDHVGVLVHGGGWLGLNDANPHVVTRDSLPLISPAMSDTDG